MCVYFGAVEQMCGSVLQRGYSGNGCLCLSTLFKLSSRVGHLIVLSWDKVRRVALDGVVLECGMVCVILLCFRLLR